MPAANAETAPQISNLKLSSDSVKSGEPVNLSFSIDRSANWVLELRNVCTNKSLSARTGKAAGAKSISWEIDTTTLAAGVYQIGIAASNSATTVEQIGFSVGLTTGTVRTAEICKNGERLLHNGSLKAQIQAAVQISQRDFAQSDLAVVVDINSSFGTLALASNHAALSDAPLLFIDGATIAPVVKTEIARLQVKQLRFVGLTSETAKPMRLALKKLVKNTNTFTGDTYSILAESLYAKIPAVSADGLVLANLAGATKFIWPALAHANRNSALLLPFDKNPDSIAYRLNQSTGTGQLIGDKRAVSISDAALFAGITRFNATAPSLTLQLADLGTAENVSLKIINDKLQPKPLDVLDLSNSILFSVPSQGFTKAQQDWLEQNPDIETAGTQLTTDLLTHTSFAAIVRYLEIRDEVSKLPLIGLPEFGELQAPANFAFSGAGLGHGIGLSQWGAYQLGKEGKSATEILLHYYTNSEVTAAYDADDLFVSLQNRIPKVGLRVKAVDAGDVKMSISSYRTVDGVEVRQVATLTEADTVTLTFNPANTTMEFSFTGNPELNLEPAEWVKVNWSGTRFAQADDQTPGLIQVVGSGEAFTTTMSAPAGKWYRFGQVQLKAGKKTSSVPAGIMVTNRVRLHDEYLYGLGEVPSSWPAAALEAQVIAARSYAYYDLYQKNKFDTDGTPKTSSRSSACDCHIYDDTRDQNFVGWSKLAEANVGDKWKAAVDATLVDENQSLVVMHAGQVAQAFYSAANGGATQNNEDVWGGTPLGYLRSVPDPGSIVAYDIVGRWSPRIRSQATLASAFGLSDVAVIDFSDRLVSGAARTVTATSISGAKSTITADQFRLRVKSDTGVALNSNWFHRSEVPLDSKIRTAAAQLMTDRMMEQVDAPSAGTTTAVLVPASAELDPAIFAAAAVFAANKSAALVPVGTASDATRVRNLLADQTISTAYVVGNVNAEVISSLSAAGIQISNVAGTSAAEISYQMLLTYTDVKSVVVVNPADTESLVLAASAAVNSNAPIVYADRNGLNPAAAMWISSKRAAEVLVVGSAKQVPDYVVASLSNLKRLDTSDPYLASQKVIWRKTTTTRYIALSRPGSNLQVALAAISTGAPLLFTSDSNLDYMMNWLRRQPLVSTVINADADASHLLALRQG